MDVWGNFEICYCGSRMCYKYGLDSICAKCHIFLEQIRRVLFSEKVSILSINFRLNFYEIRTKWKMCTYILYCIVNQIILPNNGTCKIKVKKPNPVASLKKCVLDNPTSFCTLGDTVWRRLQTACVRCFGISTLLQSCFPPNKLNKTLDCVQIMTNISKMYKHITCTAETRLSAVRTLVREIYSFSVRGWVAVPATLWSTLDSSRNIMCIQNIVLQQQCYCIRLLNVQCKIYTYIIIHVHITEFCATQTIFGHSVAMFSIGMKWREGDVYLPSMKCWVAVKAHPSPFPMLKILFTTLV